MTPYALVTHGAPEEVTKAAEVTGKFVDRDNVGSFFVLSIGHQYVIGFNCSMNLQRLNNKSGDCLVAQDLKRIN